MKTLYLAAIVFGGLLFVVQCDSAQTRVQTSASIRYWTGIACSADGNRLMAVAYPAGIWCAQITPKPAMNFMANDAKVALSWLVPSTNFVLQENSDLTPTNWVALSNTPALNLSNLNDEVVLSPTNSSGFFRLISQ